MMLFTFLALFFLLAGICIQIKNKTLIPVIFTGVMAAILVCVFRTFFLFSHRVIPYSFSENFLFLLMRQILIPLLLLYGIFFLISRDSIELKVEMFLPLTASFYMIYLPFSIISSAEGLYSVFALFMKPCMFAAMLYFLSFFAKSILASFNSKKIIFVVLYSFAALVFLMLPAMVEAMYLVNTNSVLTFFCVICYCLLALFLVFFRIIKE